MATQKQLREAYALVFMPDEELYANGWLMEDFGDLGYCLDSRRDELTTEKHDRAYNEMILCYAATLVRHILEWQATKPVPPRGKVLKFTPKHVPAKRPVRHP